MNGIATDDSGAFGESAEVAYHLPEKIFLQPMSRAVQEQRATLLREWQPYTMPEGEDDFTAVKGRGYNAFATAAASRLRYAPEGVKRAVMMIDATPDRNPISVLKAPRKEPNAFHALRTGISVLP